MTFLALLLIAHLIGDFILQPDKWVNSKFKKGVQSLGFRNHIAVHAFLLLLIYFIYPEYAWQLLIVAIGHLIIDASKIIFVRQTGRGHTRNIAAFLIDQMLHIALIVAVCAYASVDFDWAYFIHPRYLWICVGLLFLTFPTAELMRNLLSSYNEELEKQKTKKQIDWKSLFFMTDEKKSDNQSLTKAGKYIGILERILIYIFILLGQWTAVGFLITAKSVFRFGDLNQGKNRQLTEYMLIGTLLSIGIAIITALIIQFILGHLG